MANKCFERVKAFFARDTRFLQVDGSYDVFAAMAILESFPGFAKADSLALDPHKWLYQPLDCGCLLHRDPQAARVVFAQSGDYVRPARDGSTQRTNVRTSELVW
jgi:aromatic-L-amino-acid/L-tryptophan decarboxylase